MSKMITYKEIKQTIAILTYLRTSQNKNENIKIVHTKKTLNRILGPIEKFPFIPKKYEHIYRHYHF